MVRLGHAGEALPFAHAAIERARQGGNDFMLKHALATLADTHLQLGDLTAAAKAVQAAEALVRRGPDRGDTARYVDDVAARLDLARGETASARTRIESALRAVGYPQREAVNVTDDLLMTAADVALSEGRAGDAEEYARAAVRATESMARGPETSADVGESLLRLANALVAQGDYAAALPLLARAERCLSNGLGKQHALTQRARTLPGAMLAQRST